MSHKYSNLATVFFFINANAFGEEPKKEQYVSPYKSAIFERQPPTAVGEDGELRKLTKERFVLAQNILRLDVLVFNAMSWDIGPIDPTMPMGPEIIRSYFDLEPTREEKLAILTEYYNFTKNFESGAKRRFDAGGMKKQDMLTFTYNRIDAEIQLLKAKEAK